MDARRHSIDFPISRTLVALRRVRSLRDPSTNSMSKLSALGDNMNWETKSSNAITLGFSNGCNEGTVDNDAPEFRSSSLFMPNKHNGNDLKLVYSSRLYDLKMQNGIDNSYAHLLNREMVCEGKESGINSKEGVDFNSTIASGVCTEGRGLFVDHGKISKHTEKRDHGRLKCKSYSKNHNRISSRVIAGDVLSRVVSPCLSTSGTTIDGSCNGLSLYRSDDFCVTEAGHQGCGIRSCWTRTLKLRELYLQGRPSVEESPLLLKNASTCDSIDCHENSEGLAPYMKNPRSLCQKFMPKSFKELVGQDLVVRSLMSAISCGRIASLYLFHGPRGVGKTSAARVFAAAMNCISPEIDKPCGTCRNCTLFFHGKSQDVKEVHSVMINSMRGFRSLTKNAISPSVYSRFKVYIIDECHLMQEETWAMMLNKLDELPQQVVFIVVTPDLDMLPCSAVLKSQRYHFQLVKEVDIVSQLGKICVDEGLEFQDDALQLIASKSNGSLRDAAMMLDHLSLLGKKITVPLVNEVNGVVSDDELLELLQIAMSSDASNTVKRARELMRSRIDPLQLVSLLADLIMNILSGKCEEDGSEIRRKFFGMHASEANMQQLSQALKLLSETEKQLRMSKNQATWLTVALLQLGSAGTSHDEFDTRLSLRTLHPQGGEYLGTSLDGEYLKHPVTGSCENAVPGKMGIQDDMETLELIWKRAIRICKSSSLKTFLQKQGKLVSVCLNSGIAVAELEFDHPDHVSKAEKSWKVIANVLQHMLGYNVELRIHLAENTSSQYGKSKKPYFGLFSCSHRLHLGPQFCIECRSNASESSCYTIVAGDRFVETCNTDYTSQISHSQCQAKEMITSIRNSDGNALCIGVRTPHHVLPNSIDVKNQSQADSWINCGCSYPSERKPKNQSRRKGCWKCKLQCWRATKVPFHRAQTLMQKRLY